MNRFISKGAISLTAALLLLPGTTYASAILSFSNLMNSSGTVDLTGGTVTVNLNSYTLGGVNHNTIGSPFFTETYNNMTGVLTFAGTATDAGGPLNNLANTTFLTINEASGLLNGQSFPISALSIYSGVSSISLTAAFIADLGLTSDPIGISTANVSVTTGGSGSTGTASVTSTVSSFTFVNTPEPSSFSLMGFAMLLGGGAVIRMKRLRPARLPGTPPSTNA